MNVYVSVDIEGISGVVHADMMMPGEREYDRGRRLMTGDANAAIEGLVQAGAGYILVADGHGPMRNLLIEELHPAAHLVTGTANARDHCQLEGADSRQFDAAVFIGYHAMAKTFRAIHPHTIAGGAVYELRINGRPHGETGLNAAILGALGIPVVLVTGDETTVAEARDFLGAGIETVAVKEACGRNAAICRPPSATRPEITAAAARALAGRAGVQPYEPERPLQLEVDFLNMPQCDRAARTAGVERVGPLTIRVAGQGPWEQYYHLWAALRSALYEPASWLA
ncbi:MAG: D-aminopeptidase dipeptide-binding protein DppA [uncultured Thermomicrobiales bacterium]|uniref:D-aminopeptidase dipeptide-binding protein DppA n=1 Tax=uncultured Thermomicrobiales bacterium TaxID=1645740 RepID=A0A6J4UVZ0_9BACT|nr:MAG: D-aminopeptidase dipeptide-binding protein DppA [uncultured Thermomicrobiales bacterium]